MQYIIGKMGVENFIELLGTEGKDKERIKLEQQFKELKQEKPIIFTYDNIKNRLAIIVWIITDSGDSYDRFI